MERMEEELIFWADSSIDRKCGLAGLAVVYKRDYEDNKDWVQLLYQLPASAKAGESTSILLPELHAIHQALIQAMQMARNRDGKAVDVVRVFAKAKPGNQRSLVSGVSSCRNHIDDKRPPRRAFYVLFVIRPGDSISHPHEMALVFVLLVKGRRQRRSPFRLHRYQTHNPE
ncbi:hypothetical protein QBC46DRAFT_345382 [Diplogelasinospora grovesii]|uniref:Uncharacterized protein n=1 Tax=Diplogelasinospora grovesii TaxID=303347 RepID=A0AAN6N010_9PEZI|nr:hypothetical protein QBC46DRAFT_345382 [Diplogelasinospora grovesii]